MIDRINELLKREGLEPDRRIQTGESVMCEWRKPFIGIDCYETEIVVIYEEDGCICVHEMEGDAEGAVALVKEKLEGFSI